MREREGAQRTFTYVEPLHAPPWGTTPGGAGASSVARGCPRVRGHMKAQFGFG
jgi:hypothetical protein